ncbi:type II toxin-antitoxin system MqsA family antitoxin [Paenibacillus spongiae]|uniref:type II toxin-antitoxin system MqsA family antitoxin n=1 Tax=Paenibacillus spongiae TaxID=2909671 RepID=UPI0035A25582
MRTCVQCGSTNLISIIDTIETTINGKTLVIPNIPATKCNDCDEIYYDHEASRYIDKQIAIFKA